MKKIKVQLLLANLVIAVIIFITISPDGDQKPDLKSEVVRMFSNLHSISISDPGKNEVVKIARDEQNWVLEKPFSWEIDEYVLSNFTTKFSHLNFKELYTVEEIEKKGEILEDYGLDANSTILEINALDETIRITLGKKTRNGDSVYAQIERPSIEEKTLWTVSENVIEISNANPAHWGSRTFVNKTLYTIDEFSVTFRGEANNTSETKLQKNGDEWSFVAPFKAPANKEKVLFFLNSLLSEKINGFPRSSGKIETESIMSNWRAKVSVKSLGESESIFLSDGGDEEDAKIAQSSSSSTIFLVEAEFMEKIADLSTQLRERTIFDLSTLNLTEIEVQKGENYLKLSRSGEGWSATEGNSTSESQVRSETESIERFVRSLNQVRIKEFLAFNPNKSYLDENGFSNPKYVLTILMNDTTKQTILVGEAIEDASLSKVYSSDQALICMVDVNLGGILSTQNLSFRTKSLMTGQEAITSFEISDLQEPRVLYSSELNSTDAERNFIRSFKAEKYIASQFKKDGAWVESEWFPWKYKVTFSSSTQEQYEFYLSEKKGATTWYCGSDKQNATFNLPIDVIDELSSKMAKKPSPTP
jgi:hypothetical protein